MCGILGFFSRHPSPDQDQRLQSALAALHHRGPDDHGLESFGVAGGRLALGHTRLSIIDLSPGGHQPMHSPDGRYTIVFNGEIYNYRELRQELKALGHAFRTDSDTEVLLAAWAQWDVEGLRRLTGMFAFAVFDRVTLTLTLARDAFGIKPLFYCRDDQGFKFASELPALQVLVQAQPAYDLQRAYDYLVYGGYDHQEATFILGIKHLMPGHLLTVPLAEPSTAIPKRWWWPSIEERTDLSFADAAAQLREMFLNNIRLHLRSDVPLGAALSGGLDSSAVVGAIRHLEPEMPIHTFSYIARGSTVDEEHWVDQINSRIGAVPHKMVVSPQELANDLDDMIRTQGEPFGSTSIYAQYRVFRLAREHGITVTLDGQGADELLAGYRGYPGARMRSLLESRQYSGLLAFVRAWSQWPGRTHGQALMLLGSLFIPIGFRRLAYRLIGQNPEPAWLKREVLIDLGVIMQPPGVERHDDAVGRRLAAALRDALSGGGLKALLRHGDRNAMRWSIESRVPFLTTEFAEFLLSLPENYLISSQGETKHIFRVAMRGIVPDTILDRKDKIGFATPEQQWLKMLGPQVTEWLDGAESLPFLDAATCRAEVRAMIDGRRPFNFQAWRLINYCRWTQIMSAR